MRGLAALLAAALLSGCAPAGVEELTVPAPAQEDRLVIYTSHKREVYDPIVREFEQRTGIWVQVETGGTAQLLERIAGEESPACDLMFGGGVESLEASRGLFAPYDSPLSEEIAEPCRCADGAWTAFSSLPVVLIYNTQLVRTNPPAGWASLLDPEWRGKIAFASPQVSGSGFTALATLVQALPGRTEELLSAFCANLDGAALEDSGDVVSQVADGSCYIGVTLEETALRGVRAGYDVAMVYPEEGTSAVPDGMAVVAGCAHEENARKFIDFALGEDVQRYLVENCMRRSVRADLFRPEEETAGLRLSPYDLAWASARRGELLALWQTRWEEDAP